MTRRWALRLTACLLAGAATLTGCSEKQEASESLPPTSSTAPSEDALPPLGPEDLPMPDEARTQDAAGAEAFVRYYFELLNTSLTDMDSRYIRLLSDGSCEVCNRIASETEADAEAGYSYRGGELTIPGDVFVKLSGSGKAEMGFVADQAPMTVLDGAGNEVPELVFAGVDVLNSGAICIWDEAGQTWKLTELTLG